MNAPQEEGTPLAGVKVVDLTTVVLGPYASQLLADYGAEVIKIESPQGDSTRRTGPAKEPGMAAAFLGVNRNKKSVVLDIKQEADRVALRKLVRTADVFMHNVRPQKMASLGLDPETLRSDNPRLVYAGLHGFGDAGPYSGLPAYDDIIQGMSGIAALARAQHGEPNYVPSVIADKACGVFAAMAISMALTGRARTGLGSFVEIPMFECMTSFTLVEHLAGHHFNPPLGEMGYGRLLTPWRRPYKTADGHICAVPYTDKHWASFFSLCGRADLVGDARFQGMTARTKNIAALYQMLGEQIARHTTEYWLDTLKAHDIPVARLQDLEDLASDPHLVATDFFRKVADGADSVTLADAPVKFNRQRVELRMPPRLGEHTDEVLRDLRRAASA